MIKFLPLRSVLGDRRLKKRLRPEYVAACRFFSAPLIDRTGTLDAGIEFDILDRLDNLPKTEKSFADICADRAAAIALKSIDENRKIRLLWSGGIDSTLALVSLCRELEKIESLQNLEVLLSRESIAEYPAFFRDVIEAKLEFVLFEPPIFDFLDAEKIIVTGEHGDQLFGSDKAQHFVITGQAFRPVRDVLPLVVARRLGTDEFTARLIEYLAPQIEKSPVPVKTLFDFLWWMNFSLKWQHVSLRMFCPEFEDRFALEENLVHFFSAREFQSWSVSNHALKIEKTWKSYKYVAKRCIYDFHPDREYLLNKEKEPSLKDAIVTRPTLAGILKRSLRDLFPTRA